MRIYLDVSPVIYLVEQVTPWAAKVQSRLTASGVVLVSSDLTHIEILVRPIRRGDSLLQANFEAFFSSQVTEMVPFTRAVFDRAAQIRAVHNIKTPDALHLAAAVEAGCDQFLTNDAQLARFPGITIDVVS
jgi:predicted nucleic acid-binding protein